MSDLISREALLDIAEQQGHVTVDDILSCEAVAPEVKRGEWILRHVGAGHYWECSSCHKNPCIYVTKDTSFCPNCGARMDQEETR